MASVIPAFSPRSMPRFNQRVCDLRLPGRAQRGKQLGPHVLTGVRRSEGCTSIVRARFADTSFFEESTNRPLGKTQSVHGQRSGNALLPPTARFRRTPVGRTRARPRMPLRLSGQAGPSPQVWGAAVLQLRFDAVVGAIPAGAGKQRRAVGDRPAFSGPSPRPRGGRVTPRDAPPCAGAGVRCACRHRGAPGQGDGASLLARTTSR